MQTLAQHIAERGRLSPRDAVGWVVRVAKTLEPLHALGTAHGRICAEAVLAEDAVCTSRGMLLDPDEVEDAIVYHSVDRATRGADAATPENDTWALSVLLYFALTGTFPFPGVSGDDVRARIGFRPPAPIAIRGVSDDVLQCSFDRAFAPEADLRLGHAGDLRATLLLWSPTTRALKPFEFGSSLDEPVVRSEPPVPRPLGPRTVPSPGMPEPEPPSPVRVAGVGAELDEVGADETARTSEDARAMPPRGRADPVTDLSSTGVPTASSPPAGRSSKPGPWKKLAVAAALLAGGVGTGAIAAHMSSRSAGSPEPTSDRTAGASTSLAATAPGADGGPGPAATSSQGPDDPAASGATTGAPAPHSATPPRFASLDSCVASLLPDGAFGDAPPTLASLCEERDPRRGIAMIRENIVRGSTGETSEAMREWAALGWYTLATLAVMRAHCCVSAKALVAPDLLSICEVGPAFARIAAAAVEGSDATAGEAVKAYSRAVQCASTAGASTIFGQSEPPGSNQAAVFLRVLGRVRTARRLR